MRRRLNPLTRFAAVPARSHARSVRPTPTGAADTRSPGEVPPRAVTAAGQPRRRAPLSPLDLFPSVRSRSNAPQRARSGQYRSAAVVLLKSPCAFRKSTRSPVLLRLGPNLCSLAPRVSNLFYFKLFSLFYA